MKDVTIFNRKVTDEVLSLIYSEYDLRIYDEEFLLKNINADMLRDNFRFLGEGISRAAYEVGDYVVKIEFSDGEQQTETELLNYEYHSDIMAEIYAGCLTNGLIIQEKLNLDYSIEDLIEFANEEIEDEDGVDGWCFKDYFGTVVDDLHTGNMGFNENGELKILDMGLS